MADPHVDPERFPSALQAALIVGFLFVSEFLVGMVLYGARDTLDLSGDDTSALVTLLGNALVFVWILRLKGLGYRELFHPARRQESHPGTDLPTLLRGFGSASCEKCAGFDLVEGPVDSDILPGLRDPGPGIRGSGQTHGLGQSSVDLSVLERRKGSGVTCIRLGRGPIGPANLDQGAEFTLELRPVAFVGRR